MGFLNPPSYSPGQTVVASDWNTYVRDNIKAVASKCMLAYPATFGPGSGFSGRLGLTVKVYDSADTMGDATTNSRITIKQAGSYRIFGEAGAPTGAGWTVTVMKNGSTSLMSRAVGVGVEVVLNDAYAFAVSDYIEIWATTAGNVTAVAQLTRRPTTTMVVLGAEWVGP